MKERRQAVARPDSSAAGAAKGILKSGGRERSYLFHAPAGRQASGSALVMVFHGGEGDGAKMAQATGFDRVADRHGFAVVYPNSAGHWNDGRTTTANGPDDVAFVADLIDHLAATRGIDRSRVCATGASNGGMLTLRLACELNDRIAAFAPVAASLPSSYHPKCKPGKGVPMLMFNGNDDQIVPWKGGTVRSGRNAGVGGEVISVPDTLAFWQHQNGCAASPKVVALPDRDQSDGTRVELHQYQSCTSGSPLTLVKIVGGGHSWPGSPTKPLLKRLLGNVSHDISASEMVWEFCRQQHR